MGKQYSLHFGSMTLNTTHVKGKRGHYWWMTLTLDWCVAVRHLLTCAKFRISRVEG